MVIKLPGVHSIRIHPLQIHVPGIRPPGIRSLQIKLTESRLLRVDPVVIRWQDGSAVTGRRLLAKP